ncbi:SdiA-regulated domain-containing protein [Sphingobacterium sp. BN32]|uniref:SdiA-regulated domain-containing protein n=1 Tax=Sphingobacterium sp. BN32 TaxID=3058432 RepID=UPI00265D335D|nr:SdiA-regulated domain-containing protein [Sphingobacterium sp. BN32]WKK58710.1 SdiA-regulated domain-containing protein [Sphingobacterium sp. BN32]
MKLELVFSMMLFSGLASCQSPTKNNTQQATEKQEVAGLKADKTYVLPKKLNEISGITFLPADSQILYAIQDESGIVYSYNLTDEKITSEYVFADAGDYEEITTDGRFFFVLRSDGAIYSFPVDLQAAKTEVQIFEGQLGKGEYESMSYDSESKALYVLCKTCSLDKGNPAVSGYIVNVDASGKLSLKENFQINLDAVAALDGKSVKSLKPSSISKRSSSNEWYVLSSIDKLLLITDDTFQPKKVIRFEKKQFEQPEGITFDKENRMFISSEKNKAKNALLFQYNKQP